MTCAKFTGPVLCMQLQEVCRIAWLIFITVACRCISAGYAAYNRVAYGSEYESRWLPCHLYPRLASRRYGTSPSPSPPLPGIRSKSYHDEPCTPRNTFLCGAALNTQANHLSYDSGRSMSHAAIYSHELRIGRQVCPTMLGSSRCLDPRVVYIRCAPVP